MVVIGLELFEMFDLVTDGRERFCNFENGHWREISVAESLASMSRWEERCRQMTDAVSCARIGGEVISWIFLIPSLKSSLFILKRKPRSSVVHSSFFWQPLQFTRGKKFAELAN